MSISAAKEVDAVDLTSCKFFPAGWAFLLKLDGTFDALLTENMTTSS